MCRPSGWSRLSRHPRCIAIGEAGLDYHYDKSPRDVQQQVFRTHIAAARDTGLPLVIHARNADDDMIAILTDEMGRGRFDAVLHCFSSGARLAEVGVELGLYVSFSGILTFKNSDDIRRIAAAVPHDRLLVETDAPYLAPMPYRGKTQRAGLCGAIRRACSPRSSASAKARSRVITTDNFYRLFEKAPAADALDRVFVHDAARDDPRLRLLRRRAARRGRLGRVRSPNPKNRRRRCSILVETQQ